MDIFIDNCLYDDGKDYDLSLIDANCKLDSSTEEGFGVVVDFDDCGTIIEKQNSQVVMSQTVTVATFHKGALIEIPGENSKTQELDTSHFFRKFVKKSQLRNFTQNIKKIFASQFFAKIFSLSLRFAIF